MNSEQKIKALEEILDLEEGTLSVNTNLKDLEEWDSVAFFRLLR